MLKLNNLHGLSFLDVGCGSGLFSLAATVYSIDFDPESVDCAKKLKERYFIEDQNWIIEIGSVLDSQFIKNWDDLILFTLWGVTPYWSNVGCIR